MTARKLIELLQAIPPDTPVQVDPAVLSMLKRAASFSARRRADAEA